MHSHQLQDRGVISGKRVGTFIFAIMSRLLDLPGDCLVSDLLKNAASSSEFKLNDRMIN
jgi:hypothetical protein